MRRYHALLLSLLICAPAFGAPKLYLRNGIFEPGTSRYLTVPARGAVPSRYQILQFRGPVQEGWKQQATAAGAALLEYVPDYAFLVRVQPGAAAKLQALPCVAWLGPYAPAMKVDPALGRRKGDVTAVAQLFDGETPDAVVAAAKAAGLGVTTLRGQVLVKGDSGSVQSIADQPSVRWMALAPRFRAMMDRSRPLIGIDSNWRTDVGLYGDGQIVAILDTGLDKGNPKTVVDDFQGKIVAAKGFNKDDFWGDSLGHGTHVAGVILGSGVLSGSDPDQGKYARTYAGVAPLAKLVVEQTDVVLAGSTETTTDFTGSTDLSPYLDFAYQNGARIHNNSWGDDDVDQGVYSLHAQQLDKFIFEHPGYTAVFAAGNEGKDGASQKELLDTMSKLGIDPTKPLNPNDLIGGLAGYGDLIDQLTSGDPFGDGGTGGLGDGTSLGGLFGGSIGAYLQLMTDIQDMQARSTGVVELGSLSAPSTAKNVITVGASEGDRPNGQGYGGVAEGTWMQVLQVFGADPIASDYTSNNVNGMAPFSSRGPTTDGRIKPDISAPGTNIISVRSTLAEAPANNPLAGDAGNPVYWGAAPNASYAYAGGTSVSAPMVSGAAALVREYYQKKGIAEPSAALIKATLINTAVDMAPGQYGTGDKQEMTARPNFVEGWGRLNLSSLSPVAAQKLAFQEAGTGLATGDSATLTYHVAEAGKPLHFTLVWSDAPGSPTAAKALVNDLDLSVKAPDGSTLLGNGAEDHANNVEGVDIASAAAGDYVLTVKATNVPEGPQPYAVVASGALTTGTSGGGVPGDLNGDGKVTVADAVSALKIAVGSVAAPVGDALTLADVAPKPGTGGRAVGDGKVDVQDAIRILKHILGMDAGQWP